jgi:hypothetical protein
MKSHHLIRRPMPRVRPVHRNPYPQVRVYRLSDAGIRVRCRLTSL